MQPQLNDPKSQKHIFNSKKGYIRSNLSMSVFLSDMLNYAPFHHRLNYALAVFLTMIEDLFL